MPDAVNAHKVQTLEGAGAEGFSLGWSPVVAGRLASGDSIGRVVVHEGADVASPGGGGSGSGRVLRGHRGGVECLTWSPTEGNVLATGGADGTLRIWDLSRAPPLPGGGESDEGGECSIVVRGAHEGDVNAVSWNALEPHLLATGGEEGTIKVCFTIQRQPRRLSHSHHVEHYAHVSMLVSTRWNHVTLHFEGGCE
jgi:WD40 repeat protein